MEQKQTAAQFVNEARRARDAIHRARREATGGMSSDSGGSLTGIDTLSWLTKTSDLIPDWWSRERDRALSSLWKQNQHLSLALYNTQAKLVGIPFEIQPRDTSNQQHWDEARELQMSLEVTAEFGRGWSEGYSFFVEDYLTTDNGAFFEIIGPGPIDGPIIGRPITVRHLDSLRVKRTGNAEFPLLYKARDGKFYKMHWTRVIYMAQMPSSRERMYGVGFCAVSRCIEIATTLTDIIRYKQERLGSRPMNQLLVGKGMSAQSIMEALARVDGDLSARGFSHYAKTVAIGSENPDISIEKVDLAHTEPFDEMVSINLGMFAIAAALGMDADEVWPTSGSGGGGSSGDANLRRMRSRGRLPQQLTQSVASQFNFKFLPPHLIMRFDFKDDAQDQQEALIKDIRGRNRERDISTGTIDNRSARLQMVEKGDLAQNSFDEMELKAGRLPDGSPVSQLFFSTDLVYMRYLDFMDNPLLFTRNSRKLVDRVDPVTLEIGQTTTVDTAAVDEVIIGIETQRQVVLTDMVKTISHAVSNKLRESLFALDWLEEQYNLAAGRGLPEVPMAQRSVRTDIRVEPVEPSPAPADGTSPARQGGSPSADADGESD